MGTITASLCCVAAAAALLSAAPALAAPANCQSPESGSSRAPLVRPALAAVVTGSGRLQFYSAPSRECPLVGTFVIPNDRVIIYAQTDDSRWSWVAYLGGPTPLETSGWVLSARLKPTGEMAPRN